MNAKEFGKKLEILEKEVAKYKMQFNELKLKRKAAAFREKRQIRALLNEVRTNLRKSQKDRNYIKKQYKLACKAEGKSK